MFVSFFSSSSVPNIVHVILKHIPYILLYVKPIALEKDDIQFMLEVKASFL